MEIVNQVLTILENGDWYSLEELNNYIYTISKSQIECVLDFLFRYNFLEKNYTTGEFRLIPKLVSLIELEK